MLALSSQSYFEALRAAPVSNSRQIVKHMNKKKLYKCSKNAKNFRPSLTLIDVKVMNYFQGLKSCLMRAADHKLQKNELNNDD